MAEKQTVVQNEDGTTTVYVKPDIIGIFGELVGCAGGILAGGFVGMQVAKAVGPVTTTIERVGKAALIGSVGIATEYYVSEGVSSTFDNFAELSDWSAEKIRSKSQKILAQAAGGQPVENPAQKQGTRKK